MRTLAKPIEMITFSDETGVMIPLRLKIKTKDNKEMVFKIDRVVSRELERLAGNVMILYKCKGVIENKEREFEVKYEMNSCKWMLWRI